MKYHISNVIVVEGKDDEAFLSSFIDAIYVKTNGYQIPKEEIDFLNNPRNQKPIIILTDSDIAGKQIRERINKLVSKGLNIEVDIVKCNKKNKHGVAECEREEVINALKEHIDNIILKETITNADIVSLDIDKSKREIICDELKLGLCNNKTFIKRLNYLGYTKEELKKYGNK